MYWRLTPNYVYFFNIFSPLVSSGIQNVFHTKCTYTMFLTISSIMNPKCIRTKDTYLWLYGGRGLEVAQQMPACKADGETTGTNIMHNCTVLRNISQNVSRKILKQTAIFFLNKIVKDSNSKEIFDQLKWISFHHRPMFLFAMLASKATKS